MPLSSHLSDKDEDETMHSWSPVFRRSGARELVQDAVLAGARVGLVCCTSSAPLDDVVASVRRQLGPGISSRLEAFTVPGALGDGPSDVGQAIDEAKREVKRTLAQAAVDSLNRASGPDAAALHPSLRGGGSWQQVQGELVCVKGSRPDAALIACDGIALHGCHHCILSSTDKVFRAYRSPGDTRVGPGVLRGHGRDARYLRDAVDSGVHHHRRQGRGAHDRGGADAGEGGVDCC